MLADNPTPSLLDISSIIHCGTNFTLAEKVVPFPNKRHPKVYAISQKRPFSSTSHPSLLPPPLRHSPPSARRLCQDSSFPSPSRLHPRQCPSVALHIAARPHRH